VSSLSPIVRSGFEKVAKWEGGALQTHQEQVRFLPFSISGSCVNVVRCARTTVAFANHAPAVDVDQAQVQAAIAAGRSRDSACSDFLRPNLFHAQFSLPLTEL
jgi:hypothetical protein